MLNIICDVRDGIGEKKNKLCLRFIRSTMTLPLQFEGNRVIHTENSSYNH